jgi:hypothetical protein
VLLTIVAGWALLPTVNFVPTEAPFPYWILGTALPAGYFVTKATITSLTALTGVLLFDPRAMRRFRLKWWDLPMMLWCALPLLSRIANHALNQGALREGLRGMLYQLLALGYFLLARPPVFLRRCLYPADLRLTLAAALLLAAIDNLMNSGMILPLVLVIGGMSAHSPAAGDVEAGVEDGPGFEKRFSRSTPATPGDGESPAIESGVASAPIYDLGCMAKDSDLREHHWVGRSTASAIRRAPVRSVPAIRSEECAERLKGKPHRAIRVGLRRPLQRRAMFRPTYEPSILE